MWYDHTVHTVSLVVALWPTRTRNCLKQEQECYLNHQNSYIDSEREGGCGDNNITNLSKWTGGDEKTGGGEKVEKKREKDDDV